MPCIDSSRVPRQPGPATREADAELPAQDMKNDEGPALGRALVTSHGWLFSYGVGVEPSPVSVVSPESLVSPEPPVDAAPWSTTRLATTGCVVSTVAPLSIREWTTTRSPTATSARSRLPSPFTSATTIRAFETSNVTVWPFRARPRWLPPVTSTSIVPVPTAETVPLTMRARPCLPCLWPALLPPLCPAPLPPLWPWNAPLPWPPPCATAAAGSARAATTPSATSGRINFEFILPPSETGLPRVLRPLGFAPPPHDGFALSRSFRFASYQHA